jgi:hypothetical protein
MRDERERSEVRSQGSDVGDRMSEAREIEGEKLRR